MNFKIWAVAFAAFLCLSSPLRAEVSREGAQRSMDELNELLGEYQRLREPSWVLAGSEKMLDGTTRMSYIETKRISGRQDLVSFTLRRVYEKEQRVESEQGRLSYIETYDVIIIDCISAIATYGDILYVGVNGLPIAEYKPEDLSKERHPVSEDEILSILSPQLCRKP
jgi:hypothetical protein